MIQRSQELLWNSILQWMNVTLSYAELTTPDPNSTAWSTTYRSIPINMPSHGISAGVINAHNGNIGWFLNNNIICATEGGTYMRYRTSIGNATKLGNGNNIGLSTILFCI